MHVSVVLLSLALYLSAGAAAQAQSISCTANQANLPPVRSDGVAELVGGLVIDCTGGTPTASGLPIPRYNIALALDTTITSRILNSGGSEALLLLDDPIPAQQLVAASLPSTDQPLATGMGAYFGGTPGRPTVFVATQTSPTTILFQNVPIDQPGPSAHRQLRIVNVRANANLIGVSQSPLPNVINAAISISGTPELPLVNPVLTVAAVSTGMQALVTPASMSQCAPGANQFKVKFSELYGTGFQLRVHPSTSWQNVPSLVYDSLSGFTSPAFTGTPAEGAGAATQGTRLFIRLSGVPANVALKVPTSVTSPGPFPAADATAVLVSQTTDGSTADASGNVVVTGGAGMAVWEFTSGLPAAIDAFSIDVNVIYAASPAPGEGIIKVQTGYAPETAVVTASATAPLPRYISTPLTTNAFTISSCGPAFSVDHATLGFAALPGGGSATPPQSVLIRPVYPENRGWSTASNQPWLSVSPASGTGAAKLTLSLVPGALPAPGNYSATVTVSGGDSTFQPARIICSLTVKTATTAPFGVFETPADGLSGVSGAIPVTGWALDDIAVDRVMIYRDRVSGETAGGPLYVGDAIFVPGARPDVERASPGSPLAYRAGWGYMLLTNTLPNQGNGTVKLYAIAVDRDGQQTTLGTKTIQVDNANATKPFGSIATPAPGASVSGASYVNFGWALTPSPGVIIGSGVIRVFIDGQKVGEITGGDPRSDITALFPGYADTPNAVRHYYLNTTAFSDGMHSIAWSVIDSQLRAQGIGSRYFYINNGVSASATAASTLAYSNVEPLLRRRPATAVQTRRGFDSEAALEPLAETAGEIGRGLQLEEAGRLELQLPAGATWTGYHRFGEELRPLPVGSYLDEKTAVFTWQLGPGFLGDHELVFVAADQALSVPVQIVPLQSERIATARH